MKRAKATLVTGRGRGEYHQVTTRAPACGMTKKFLAIFLLPVYKALYRRNVPSPQRSLLSQGIFYEKLRGGSKSRNEEY